MKPRFSLSLGLGIGLVAAAFLVYVVTLTPGVPPTDSGELVLAAWLPGVAHAPGFPLWTGLGWLWSHLLPFGRVIWRLNLLSASCGALAVGLIYALALRTLRVAGDQAEDATALRLVASAIAAATLGLGRTFWAWSTVAEVYALDTALVVAILLLVVRWTGLPAARVEQPRSVHPARTQNHRTHRARPAPAGAPVAGSGPRPFSTTYPLLAAAFLFGLGLGAHLTSVALLAPAIAFWITARRGWRVWVSRTTVAAALALAAGAAIYLYLPLVARTDPLLNWGQPDTWQRFWWQVTARQYRVSLLSSPVWPQVVFAGGLWWTQFTPVGLGLALVGAWQMLHRQRMLFWTLTLVIVCVTLYAWAYVIEDDGDAYYLPAFVAGALWAAWGSLAVLAALARRLNSDAQGRPRAGWAGMLALGLLVPAVALAMNWHACDRHADTISEDYVRDTFAEIGPRGVLLTRDWQLYAPALYLQHVEDLRPDLTVIDTELLRRGWYFDYLHKVDPALMAAVAGEERAFLTLRDAWEQGQIPDGDPRIGQLQAAYIALLDAFIREADAAGRPVHIGPNRGTEALRGNTLRGIPDMEAGIGTDQQWVPIGLTFEGQPPNAQAGPLASLSWRIDAFGRVMPTAPERKVQATRADMATLRAIYQASTRNMAGAQADLTIALHVEPGYAPAQTLMQRVQSQR